MGAKIALGTFAGLLAPAALDNAPAAAASLKPAAAVPRFATPPTPGALYHDGQSGRYLLGGGWLFLPDPADRGISAGFWRDTASTAGWKPITIPSVYNLGDYSDTSWRGTVGWYRRDFTLPAGAFARSVPRSARRWIVRFESINYRATVWLNGRELGGHIGPNLPFELDLEHLRPGVNRLIVRVDNRRLPGDLPPGPGNGWWNYGGILREVYLRAVQRADIAQVHIQTRITCHGCAATIALEPLVRNPTAEPQRVHLTGSYGARPLRFGSAWIAPGRTWNAQAQTTVTHPRLWWPGHPALYRLRLTLSDARGRRLAGYNLSSGIRTIKVVGGRLTINGRRVHLRGVELREQSISSGAALDRAQLRRLVAWTRELGATVIRSDPLNPQLDELADRYGLLIWSDVPVSHATDIASALSLLRQNIAANQAHPSILTWNIANELPLPTSRRASSYIAEAVALAHRLDPGRPVSMAIADWPGAACQPAYAPLDVIGLNEYLGWYDAGGGTTDDRDALGPFLDTVRSCYRRQAIFVSEFGFDGSRDGPVEERGTYTFQQNAVAYHLAVFATKPWLSGAIYFLLQDAVSFAGYSGGNPYPSPPFTLKGLISREGQRKPAWTVVAGSYRNTRQVDDQ